jgi:hypothetical protein
MSSVRKEPEKSSTAGTCSGMLWVELIWWWWCEAGGFKLKTVDQISIHRCCSGLYGNNSGAMPEA